MEIHWANLPISHAVGREQRNSDSENQPEGARRSWLIVSHDRTQVGGVVLAVPLTTVEARLHDQGLREFRVAIRPEQITQVHTDRGHVPELLVALCDQLRCLSIERFGPESRLGKLKNSEFGAIEAAIRNVLMMDEDEDDEGEAGEG